MGYKISIPKYLVGDVVNFHNHRGSLRTGEIVMVETHYTHEHRAYHIYSIKVPRTAKQIEKSINGDKFFWLHVGQENIVEKAK